MISVYRLIDSNSESDPHPPRNGSLSVYRSVYQFTMRQHVNRSIGLSARDVPTGLSIYRLIGSRCADMSFGLSAYGIISVIKPGFPPVFVKLILSGFVVQRSCCLTHTHTHTHTDWCRGPPYSGRLGQVCLRRLPLLFFHYYYVCIIIIIILIIISLSLSIYIYIHMYTSLALLPDSAPRQRRGGLEPKPQASWTLWPISVLTFWISEGFTQA